MINKNIKRSIIIIIIGLAVGYFGYTVFQQPILNTTMPVNPTKKVDRAHVLHELQQEEEQLWQNLGTIGITKNRFEQARKKHIRQYHREDVACVYKKLNPATEKYVRSLLQAQGLGNKKIAISAYNGFAPAAASEHNIFINEQELAKLSEPAQQFVINHEIQHILHHDSPSRYIMELIYGTQTNKLVNEKDHPLLQYERFKEKRADIKTALQNKYLAQGYLLFTQEWLNNKGDTSGITHPKNSDRLALAHYINQNVQFA